MHYAATQRLRRSAIALFVCTCASEPLEAQIVGLEIKNEKLLKALKPRLVERGGKLMLLGEVLSGLEIDLAKNPPSINRPANVDSIVLLVPDTAKPELELTRTNKKGERTVTNKKFELSVSIKEIGDFYHLVFPYQSCEGLREEYLRKKANLLELEAELNAIALGTPEWFPAHRRYLTQVEGLIGWLESTLYPEAARLLEKDMKKRLEKAAKESSTQRFESAKSTLKESPVPEKLDAAAKSFGAPPSFFGAETRHLRAFAHSGISKSEIENGLVTGERIVEGFRAAIVDPTLGPDEVDPIPEKLFQEYFLLPEDVGLSVRYFEEYYGKSYGNDSNRQRRIDALGQAARGAFGVDFLEFWRFNQDFEGIVAHRLGHALAALAFARGGHNVPAWLGEGMAYWTSYEFTAHNTVTCIAFALPSTYEKRSTEKEGLKPIEEGMRAAFNALALSDGPPIGTLLRMKLVEMDAPALAKSWSVIDWILAEHRLKARALFSAACAASKDERTDLEAWRPKLGEVLGVPAGTDAYKVMEESWRAYAQVGQQQGGATRR